MRNAPQRDRHQAHERHPPLLRGEPLAGRAHGLDDDVAVARGRARGAVAHEEEQPDEDNRDGRDRQRDREPGAPVELGLHEAYGDEVLRGGDGRALASDVRSQGNPNLHGCE